MRSYLSNRYIIGLACAILAIFFLSFRSILVKIAYGQGIMMMDLFYLRFFFALPMLIAFAFYKRGGEVFIKIKDRSVFVGSFFAGIFGYYLATLFDFYSLQLINAGLSRVIIYLFPIFVLIINSFYQRSLPDLKVIMLFFLTLLGVFFVVGGFDIDVLSIDRRGLLFAFFAMISYSLYIVINGEVTKKVGSVLFTCYAVFFSFLFINLHYWFIGAESDIVSISLVGWFIILSMSLFCTFLPLLLISESISRLGLIQFSLFSNLGPVFAVVISFLVLGEKMTHQQLLGVLLVMVILFLTGISKEKKGVK